jgi:hypothetical protein
MIQGPVYAKEMPDGTYRFETDKPEGSRAEKMLLDGARHMCVTEETVSDSGMIATVKVSDKGKVKQFERKYPWLDEEPGGKDINQKKLVDHVDTIR